jgi:Type II secretion system (T2SS), protein G
LKKNDLGFSRIQWLILIGFSSILIVGYIQFFHPLAKIQYMHDQTRKSDLVVIQKALEMYYQRMGKYPDASVSFQIMIAKKPLQWGADGLSPYINVLPHDPTSQSRTYVYYVDKVHGNQSYWLYASLEQPDQEPNACISHCSLGNGMIPFTACGVQTSSVQCNFGVSSQNVSP